MIKMMGMGFGFGGLGIIISWIVLLAGVVYLIKYLSLEQKSTKEKPSPIEILKSR